MKIAWMDGWNDSQNAIKKTIDGMIHQVQMDGWIYNIEMITEMKIGLMDGKKQIELIRYNGRLDL